MNWIPFKYHTLLPLAYSTAGPFSLCLSPFKYHALSPSDHSMAGSFSLCSLSFKYQYLVPLAYYKFSTKFSKIWVDLSHRLDRGQHELRSNTLVPPMVALAPPMGTCPQTAQAVWGQGGPSVLPRGDHLTSPPHTLWAREVRTLRGPSQRALGA